MDLAHRFGPCACCNSEVVTREKRRVFRGFWVIRGKKVDGEVKIFRFFGLNSEDEVFVGGDRHAEETL